MPKRKKKQVQATDFYTIEILDWNIDYGINMGLGHLQLNLDAETYNKTCTGKMILPEKMRGVS